MWELEEMQTAKDAIDGSITDELIPFSDLSHIWINIYLSFDTQSGMSTPTLSYIRSFQS